MGYGTAEDFVGFYRKFYLAEFRIQAREGERGRETERGRERERERERERILHGGAKI